MIKRSHKRHSANTIFLCVYMDENFIIQTKLFYRYFPSKERSSSSNTKGNKCPHTIIPHDGHLFIRMIKQQTPQHSHEKNDWPLIWSTITKTFTIRMLNIYQNRLNNRICIPMLPLCTKQRSTRLRECRTTLSGRWIQHLFLVFAPLNSYRFKGTALWKTATPKLNKQALNQQKLLFIVICSTTEKILPLFYY